MDCFIMVEVMRMLRTMTVSCLTPKLCNGGGGDGGVGGWIRVIVCKTICALYSFCLLEDWKNTRQSTSVNDHLLSSNIWKLKYNVVESSWSLFVCLIGVLASFMSI